VDGFADPDGIFPAPALLAANPVPADAKKALKDAEVSFDEIHDTAGKPQLGDRIDGISFGEAAKQKGNRFYRLQASANTVPEQKSAEQFDLKLKLEKKLDLSQLTKEPALAPTPAKNPARQALGIVADDERLEGEKASEDSISLRTAPLTPPPAIPAEPAQSVSGKTVTELKVENGGVYSVNGVGYTNSFHQMRGNIITLDGAVPQTLDEAETKLNAAIQLDPRNEGAYHEFDLIREQRHRAENLAREAKNNEWMLGVDKAWRGDAGKGDLLPQIDRYARTNLAHAQDKERGTPGEMINLQDSDLTQATSVNEYEPLVIPIKNGRASDIAQALNGVTTVGGGPPVPPNNAAAAGLSSASGVQIGSGGGGFGGLGGFGGRSLAATNRSSFQDRMSSIVNRAGAGAGGDIVVLGQAKVIADERSNSLLIFAKKGERDAITNVIGKLDVAERGKKAEADVTKASKVVLTGITSLSATPHALLEITEQEPGKPATTHRPSLREGERDGGIEVLSIDVEKALVKIRNGGVETNVSLEIPKPAANTSTPQPEINTRENAFSTFSLNVSDVSFKLAAASLDNSVMPEPASIRVEEFVNAFNYHDPAPAAGARMAFAWERAHYPFAHNRDIVRFAIQTAAQGREAQKPLNLVILLDNSGSMERADRVQIVREALKVLAQKLQPQDRISVVTFARTARLCVDGMAGGKPKEFLDKVLELNPEGGTNLEDALALGYATAARHFLANGMNRVILLTDGAANLGNVEPEALKQKVVSNRIKGIALDCFGIGWEGYNDDLLEVLSHNGDGRYGFLDHPEEAAPEFANQLAGALNVEAADVKTQVEFNPRRVLTWRQIGYAKHQLTKEQFRDNKVDAAELAASESGNALYAIEVNPEGSGPIGTVRVRYKIPATGQYVEQARPLPYQPKAPALDESSPAMRLAVTAAAFGEWLARSPYAGEVTPSALQPYLNSVCETYAPDSRPQRLAGMIRQAQAIAGK